VAWCSASFRATDGAASAAVALHVTGTEMGYVRGHDDEQRDGHQQPDDESAQYVGFEHVLPQIGKLETETGRWDQLPMGTRGWIRQGNGNYFEFQLLLKELQRPRIDVLVADFLIGIDFDGVIHQLIDFVLQRDVAG